MKTAILGLCISVAANGIYAARNFFDKGIQLSLTAAATIIWLFEYIFIFPSATYTLIMAFTFVYLIAYHFKKPLLRFFKMDIMFLLMVLFIGLAVLIAIITYEGASSIYGIVVMFLDLFSAFLFTSQGIRCKNGVNSVLYAVLDLSLGNYFVAALDLVNLLVSLFTAIQHRREKVIDRAGLKEYSELVKISGEFRRIKIAQRR